MSSLRRSLILSSFLLLGCAGRSRLPTVDQLELDTVVLYRNGVGYFERRGKVNDEVLRIKVRKDQVNDLLKSLTVVDADGQAVSVSMPLDPSAWSNAAMATLAPGHGSLAQILDSIRGTEITVRAHGGRIIRGRVVLVERIINEPDPTMSGRSLPPPPESGERRDWKLSLLTRGQLQVVRLSKIRAITLHDGDLAMQLHRSLDASAGEGMFEQVEVEVRLTGARSHKLTVSYVVAAPMWKPTYRVVLPEDGKGEALLQGWAVIDNLSGEDWDAVSLSLTSGAPISFRYDLHTPREVYRRDMSQAGGHRQAAVALGETTVVTEAAPEPEPSAAPTGGSAADGDGAYYEGMLEDEAPLEEVRERRGLDKKKDKRANSAPRRPSPAPPSSASIAQAAEAPGLDLDALQQSTAAAARSQRISGLTRIDLSNRVTVPDGTSTMVALINETIDAEQTFLFRPGGAGYGYEQNPYRVLRFRNSTQYVLEPGPISIYAGGSFVGEGLSEAVGANTSVTIPFAVESEIFVSSSREYGQEMTLTRIVRGVLEAETYYQTTTTWEVRGPAKAAAYTVLIRQPQSGPNYSLSERPAGTEDLENAWLIPVEVPAQSGRASQKVVEQTPSTTKLEIWDPQAPALLDKLLAAGTLDASARAKLQPIVDLRRAIGKIDTEVEGLRRQQRELERRAEETRKDLEALEKNASAGALRKKLAKRLDQLSSDADAKGKRIIELESDRLEQVIELENLLEDIDLRTAATPETGSKPTQPKQD